MRVPIRKAGKHTNIKPDPYLTPEKLNELKVKLERMKSKQPKLAAEVRRLASDGDFSENAGYQLAKGRLRGLNQRILDLENHLKVAMVIEPSADKSSIQIGSTVEVEVNGRIKTFTILGSSETDPLQGIISHTSPTGAALLKRRVGDAVDINLKDKKIKYTIKKIK